ncbi:MAG: hypothetical protein M1822_009039 [Bathelium mastoideum]|nr:MAG: hypothetical protein M1822_009039 [Bathelium mastoideum]
MSSDHPDCYPTQVTTHYEFACTHEPNGAPGWSIPTHQHQLTQIDGRFHDFPLMIRGDFSVPNQEDVFQSEASESNPDTFLPELEQIQSWDIFGADDNSNFVAGTRLEPDQNSVGGCSADTFNTSKEKPTTTQEVSKGKQKAQHLKAQQNWRQRKKQRQDEVAANLSVQKLIAKDLQRLLEDTKRENEDLKKQIKALSAMIVE